MSAYNYIGLTLLALALLAVVLAVHADARAQRAHEAWRKQHDRWLAGGMKGRQP